MIVGTLLLGLGPALEAITPAFAAILTGEVVRGIGYTCTSGAMDAWLAGEVGAEQVGDIYLRGAQVDRFASLVGIPFSVLLAGAGLHLPLLLGAGVVVLMGLGLALIMTETGFQPAAWFGLIRMGTALLSIGVIEVIRRRLDTNRERLVAMVLLVGGCLQAVGMVGFAVAGSFAAALACYWGVTVCRGISDPLRNTWLVRHVAPQVRATVLSTVSQGEGAPQTAGAVNSKG